MGELIKKINKNLWYNVYALNHKYIIIKNFLGLKAKYNNQWTNVTKEE